MDKTLLPSRKATQEWDTQNPVIVSKKIKVEDPSDHSFRKRSCLLMRCRVTSLFINLIKNQLELMKKEEQIKPRLIPCSVETVRSLESMPYAPNRVRGRKARPRCLLCPGAQHSTCIPRRRVISMTPASACCKVGQCYTPPTDFRSPCLPPPSDICYFQRHPPCTMRPCVQRPTTPVKSKFPHKRESYMHTPCNSCERKLQCGGCVSVTQLRPTSIEPMPSCYDCPALAPCQPKSKPRAKPKLSRSSLCKRQCVLNPCKRQISSSECSGQCTAATTTEETNFQASRVTSRHSPTTEGSIQKEVNTDNINYCISTQTSKANCPEAQCGPSYCCTCTSHPKVAQTDPSRTNVVKGQDNIKTRIEVPGPKNCFCQPSCEPVPNMYQPLATGVFIRFPDMVTNGCYGVPAVVASSCPMGGTIQDRRPSTQDLGPRQREQLSTTDPGQRQWDQSSTTEQALPPRRNLSDATGPTTQMHPPQIQEPQRTSQDTPASQDPSEFIRWTNPSRINGPQDFNGANCPPDLYKPQATSFPTSPQGSNGSLGHHMRMAGPSGPYGPQVTDPSGPYDSQLQPVTAKGAYGPQSMYTRGMDPGTADISYGNSGNCYCRQSPGPNITASSRPTGQRQVMSGPESSGIREPFGRQPRVHGPQSLDDQVYSQIAPTDAYDRKFVLPGGTCIGTCDPKTQPVCEVSRNVAYGPQSRACGKIGRPGENNTSNKAYGHLPHQDGSSDQYGPQPMGLVDTNGTNRPQTIGSKTRSIGVDESSSQTESYGPQPVAAAYGQPLSTDTPGMEDTGQGKTNGAKCSKSRNSSQTQKTICKPKRFYCTQSGQNKAKDTSQAHAKAAGVRFQEQSEAEFDDQDDTDTDMEPREQEQYSQSNGQQYEFSTQATERQALNDPNSSQSNVAASFRPRRKSVNYNPQVTDIRDSVTPESDPKDAFRPQAGPVRLGSTTSVESPKCPQECVSFQRRKTNSTITKQRKLTADAVLGDDTVESHEVSEQLKLSEIKRKTTAPISMRQHHATADAVFNQAVRISSNDSQITIKITPFPQSPPFSRTSSAEKTNVPTTKRPSKATTPDNSVRLSGTKGQTKPRSLVTPARKLDTLPSKKRKLNESRGPDNQSRSASPQRKASNQSQESAQSKTSKRKTSSRRKSAEQVEKAKTLCCDQKIDVKSPNSVSEDDRAARGARPLSANRHRSSYYNQETGFSDSEIPNIDVGTSVRQQNILEPPLKSDRNTCGLCEPHPAKRRGSDLGGILPCQGQTQTYQQLCEYSSGEEGDHGTSTESINSNSGSIGEEIICTKLSEKIACIKSSGTDLVEDTAPCWSHRLGSLCRPITRLHRFTPRHLSPCDLPCKTGLNNACVIPPCHRNLPSHKRPPRLTVDTRPPSQNINTGRNARRQSNSTPLQPLPPCQRIPPGPCPGRTKSTFTSSISPSQSPPRMSPRHRTQDKVSCRCNPEDESRSTESLECRKGRAEGYPCSVTPSSAVQRVPLPFEGT